MDFLDRAMKRSFSRLFCSVLIKTNATWNEASFFFINLHGGSYLILSLSRFIVGNKN